MRDGGVEGDLKGTGVKLDLGQQQTALQALPAGAELVGPSWLERKRGSEFAGLAGACTDKPYRGTVVSNSSLLSSGPISGLQVSRSGEQVQLATSCLSLGRNLSNSYSGEQPGDCVRRPAISYEFPGCDAAPRDERIESNFRRMRVVPNTTTPCKPVTY